MSDVLQALYRGDRDEAERLAVGRELTVFEAAALGRTARVRELLDENQSLVNEYGDDGFHPVGLAAFFGHLDTVRLLLERGADVNQLSRNDHVQTAVIHAAAAAEGNRSRNQFLTDAVERVLRETERRRIDADGLQLVVREVVSPDELAIPIALLVGEPPNGGTERSRLARLAGRRVDQRDVFRADVENVDRFSSR